MKKEKYTGRAKEKKQSDKRRGSIARRVLLVVTILLAVGILTGIGVVVYVAATLDSTEDMKVMEAMRGSRTTRIWTPRRESGGESIDASNYFPVEYDILYGDENMVWADGSEIPDLLKNAFVAIEDQRFYSHRGVDWRRTGKAVLNYIFRFEPQFGGSTITQQLIKNVHGEKDISAMRKLKEIIRARRLEKEYSKEEILTYYLNIVPLGHQCTGVKSAARYYFGKSLSELTAVECASLAAITNAPAYYEPQEHPENNALRRNLVLQAMHQNGYLDADAYENAKGAMLVLNVTDPVYSKRSRGWYTETVAADVTKDLMQELGLTKSAATALVYRGGLEIYSLVDPAVQSEMENYFANAENFTIDGKMVQGGMVICDPRTGDLLGVVGSVGAKQGSLLFNRATDGYYQPGSVLKPVALYGPALERNLITYSTVFEDLPEESESGVWPHNSPGVYQGRITVAEAITKSKNTVAVRLYGLMGKWEVFRYLRDTVGFTGLVSQESGKTDLGASPLALGQLTRGVTVREMTGAYTAFAAGGVQVDTRTYAAVFDSHGELLLRKDAQKKRVMSEETAYILTEMLEGVVDHGTAHRITLDELVATAGKTGTSGMDKDKWFVGYTPSYVAGIRIGYDTPESLPAGCNVHLTAWDRILHGLYQKMDGMEDGEMAFAVPRGIRQCEYCLDSGMVPTDACRSELRGSRVATGLYKEDHIPTAECDVHTTAHYDILTEKYGLGEGNPETSLDFYVLYLPGRRLPSGILPQDAEYEFSTIAAEQEKGDAQDTP